jgi:GAF domain-containing protein
MTEYLLPISVAFITAVIGPVLVEWTKSLVTNKKNKLKTPIQEALELNEAIDTQLELVLDELGCDQVWIAQFHNGGHFYPTGKSIQKFSIFYEKLTPSTPSVQHTFQNIPVSLFPKALSKIYKDNELDIANFRPKTETYDLDSFHDVYGAKSLYLTGLQSLDDHMIGVLCITYNQNEHTMTEDEWNYVRQKLGVIGTLLAEYLKTNVKKK